jgi:hypothetical protein
LALLQCKNPAPWWFRIFPAIELDLVFNAIQTFQIPIDETDHYLAWFCVIAEDVIQKIPPVHT